MVVVRLLNRNREGYERVDSDVIPLLNPINLDKQQAVESVYCNVFCIIGVDRMEVVLYSRNFFCRFPFCLILCFEIK